MQQALDVVGVARGVIVLEHVLAARGGNLREFRRARGQQPLEPCDGCVDVVGLVEESGSIVS